MKSYELDIRNTYKDIKEGKLNLGGKNPQGDTISFNNYYMMVNSKPFLGIAGEFHYSRYPYKYWEEEIIKIKESGINILATYVFWIHHEEVEGEFDWHGDRNLRYFIDLCDKYAIYVIVRIGPFCHGECRNGGIPDWLYGRPFPLRSNHPDYLKYVKRLYQEISNQLNGMFYQNGGPIIGIQLENEYMHAGAPWEMTAKQREERITVGSDGKEHMKVLKELAVESGLEVPLYTSTGWGGAPVLEGEVLPLYGAYAFTPWNITEENPVQSPTNHYLYESFHDNEYSCREFNPPYQAENYPYACCEMGGGMQVWYQARFVVPPESVEAMTNIQLAGGCNFLGYYMYHGGTNPRGKSVLFLNENTTPKMSYDFQAPIGEYGQIRESYKYLKPIFYFLNDFAEILAPMVTILPEDTAESLEDIDKLRYAARISGKSGFVFLNNYQDHVEMKSQQDIILNLKLDKEDISIPVNTGFNLEKDVSAILPFNLDIDKVLLKYATSQLVTKINNSDDSNSTWFFAQPRGMSSEFCFDLNNIKDISVTNGIIKKDNNRIIININCEQSAVINIITEDDNHIIIYNMTREEVLNFWKLNLWGQERIVISDSVLLNKKGGLELEKTGDNRIEISIYPGLDKELSVSTGKCTCKNSGIFQEYIIELEEKEVDIKIEQEEDNKAIIKINKDSFERVKDIFLSIDYTGDIGNAFIEGHLINDNFFNGTSWEIGLKRYYPELCNNDLYLYITPIQKGKVVIKDSSMAPQQEFIGEMIAKINSIKTKVVYNTTIYC